MTQLNAIDVVNPETLCWLLDDGPEMVPVMLGERSTEEIHRGYMDLAYSIVVLALQEDTPDAIRANPVLAWWVDEVLEMDIKVLLAGLRRRKGKLKFPRVRETTDDNNEPEECDYDAD